MRSVVATLPCQRASSHEGAWFAVIVSATGSGSELNTPSEARSVKASAPV